MTDRRREFAQKDYTRKEYAKVRRDAWNIWWAAFLTMIFVLLVSWLAVQPAAAAPSVASPKDLAEAACTAHLYEGLTGTAEASSCQATLYLPTSAAFKCELYKDSGYPSRMMKKACQLLELGYLDSLGVNSQKGLN